jgi:predicted sulfurtransferase
VFFIFLFYTVGWKKGGMTVNYRVLLFYKYTTIEDPESFAKEHLAFGKEIGIKGRILVAKEGINGTLSGTIEATDAYMEKMESDPRFKGIYYKIDEVEDHAFKKLFVRPRKELVSLNLEDDIDPLELTGKYLEPKDFKEALLDENTVVIDARNDYEYDLGHFPPAARSVLISAVSVNCLNGSLRTKKNSWIKKWSLTVQVGFAARNSPAGCYEKDSKT